MRNIEVAKLLALVGGLGVSVGGPAFGAMDAGVPSPYAKGRVLGRWPGNRNPAGTKLAKKAAKGTLTINGIR